MSQSLNARLRGLWLDVHLWLGVGLMIVLIPLSVTGSALVWHDQIDRALHDERYAVSGPDAAQPVQAYAAAAQTAFAGRATLSQIRLPQKAGDPVVAVGRLNGPTAPGGRPRSLNVWIDPPTARVLGVADVSQGVMMILHRVHGTLMIPQVGRKVVGWLGWAMFISCATGLWLWWPRNGAFLKGLRWRRSPDTLFNLHHMVGFWICLPLAVLSLTGVYISFPQTSRALFGVQAPAAAPQAGGEGARRGGEGRGPAGAPRGGDNRFAPPVADPQQSLGSAVAAALEAAPGARLAAVNYPQEGRRPAWRVDVAKPGVKQPVTVRVDDESGRARVAAGQGAGAPGGGDPVSRWMRRIHDGSEMGIVWQVIIFLGGLAPAALGVTGLIMWLQRRGRKAAMARRLAEA